MYNYNTYIYIIIYDRPSLKDWRLPKSGQVQPIQEPLQLKLHLGIVEAPNAEKTKSGRQTVAV